MDASKLISKSFGNVIQIVCLLILCKCISWFQCYFFNIRYNILIDTARKHGNTKVMMGDCSTRLSVRLLSDISQGRGAHVAMETVGLLNISILWPLFLTLTSLFPCWVMLYQYHVCHNMILSTGNVWLTGFLLLPDFKKTFFTSDYVYLSHS